MIDCLLPAWWWCKANSLLCVLQDADYWLHYKRLHLRRRTGIHAISNAKWGQISTRIGELHGNSLERWTRRHHPEYFTDEEIA